MNLLISLRSDAGLLFEGSVKAPLAVKSAFEPYSERAHISVGKKVFRIVNSV